MNLNITAKHSKRLEKGIRFIAVCCNFQYKALIRITTTQHCRRAYTLGHNAECQYYFCTDNHET